MVPHLAARAGGSRTLGTGTRTTPGGRRARTQRTNAVSRATARAASARSRVAPLTVPDQERSATLRRTSRKPRRAAALAPSADGRRPGLAAGTRRTSARTTPHARDGEDQVEDGTHPGSRRRRVTRRQCSRLAAHRSPQPQKAALWITCQVIHSSIPQWIGLRPRTGSVNATKRAGPGIGPLNETQRHRRTPGGQFAVEGAAAMRLRCRRKIAGRTLAELEPSD